MCKDNVMSTNNTLLAQATLKSEVGVIPEEGLAVAKLRIEIADEKKLDSFWIAELNNLGALPWFKGEMRKVELRVMSDQFKKHVMLNKPNLLMRYGSDIVGSLILE